MRFLPLLATALLLQVRSSGAQCEVQRLLAPNGQPGDLFGAAMACDSERLVIGAPLADRICPGDPNCNSGAIWIYERAAGRFELSTELWPADGKAGDKFGQAIAIEGGLLAVSSGPDGLGITRPDRVHVYERRGGEWVRSARLRAPGQVHGDLFGRVLCVSGDTIFAGAAGDDHSGMAGVGSVHVFERSSAGWRNAAELRPWVPCPGMEFGAALAVSGDTLFVGSPGDPHSGEGAGSVHIFRRTGGAWVFVERLLAHDADWHDGFGRRIAADSRRAAIAARGQAVGGVTSAGAIHVFEREATGWKARGVMGAQNPVENLRVGWSLALSTARSASQAQESGRLLAFGRPSHRQRAGRPERALA
jgi:hypothetical protein